MGGGRPFRKEARAHIQKKNMKEGREGRKGRKEGKKRKDKRREGKEKRKERGNRSGPSLTPAHHIHTRPQQEVTIMVGG